MATSEKTTTVLTNQAGALARLGHSRGHAHVHACCFKRIYNQNQNHILAIHVYRDPWLSKRLKQYVFYPWYPFCLIASLATCAKLCVCVCVVGEWCVCRWMVCVCVCVWWIGVKETGTKVVAPELQIGTKELGKDTTLRRGEQDIRLVSLQVQHRPSIV